MLKVLMIIGIVLGSIILLALIAICTILFVPFRYRIGGSNKETLTAYFLLTFLLSIVRIKVYYKEKMGWASLRLFGIKIFDKEIPELIEFVENLSDKFSKKKKDSDSAGDKNENPEEAPAKAETIPEEETVEYELTEEEFEKYLNEPDEFDDMNAIEKNISFLSSLKEFVLNIKKKWYNFKEFVNEKLKQWEKTKKIIKFYWKVIHYPSFKPTLILFKDIMLKVIKHVFPRKWRMKIVYGDEDPYITGKVHSYICMARGYFNREIDFTPVWDESRFEIDGYVGGRVQIIVFLSVGFKLLTNKHLRRMILLIRRGGKTRG